MRYLRREAKGKPDIDRFNTCRLAAVKHLDFRDRDAGACGLDDGLNAAVYVHSLHHHLDFDLGQKVHHILGPAARP